MQFTADRSHNPVTPTALAAVGSPAWQNTPDGFAVFGQPDREHVIFPSDDYPADPATYTIRITTPADVDGVASGQLVSRRHKGNRVTSVYQLDRPAPTDVVQVAVGHFTEIDGVGPRGLPVRSYVPEDAPAGAVDAARQTPGQIAWLEQQLGRPFPYRTYGTLGLDLQYPGALETATLSTFGVNAVASPQDAPVREHELVHQYFGDAVPVRSWDDMWLSEGHATYYQELCSAENGGKSLDEQLKQLYTDVLPNELADQGPIAHLKYAGGLMFATDDGGALTLYALRNLVGQATFRRIEQTFYDTFRGRSASTQDYIDVANRVSGRHLDSFFQGWLYGATPPPMPGHPDWHAS